MPTPDALAEAIDRLYAAFADVPRPTAIDACSHCLDEAETAALLKPVPVRELTVEVLRPYTGSALLTVGEVPDFKYFLPRMLHIACTEGSGTFGFGGFGRRLAAAEWSTWPLDEQTAIRDVLHAFWRALLQGRWPRASVERALDDVWVAERDIGPYLDEWSGAMRVQHAVSELLVVVRHSSRPLNHVHCREHGPDDRCEQFVGWFCGPGLTAAIADALAVSEAPEDRASLTEIAEAIVYFSNEAPAGPEASEPDQV